jgi:predicted RNase H-like HicB family nuclease
MTYDILIRPTESGFAATILGLPDCTSEASTRDEAIQRVKAEAEDLLARSEIVQAEINGTAPRKSFAGMWANDSTFNDFITAMKSYREELNADPSQP